MISTHSLLIQGAIMFIVVLIAGIFFLNHALKMEKSAKYVLLICATGGVTSWKIFDTTAETNTFIEKKLPKGCVFSIIRATDANKHLSNSH